MAALVAIVTLCFLQFRMRRTQTRRITNCCHLGRDGGDFYITAPDGVLLNREAFLKRIANPYPGTHAEPVD